MKQVFNRVIEWGTICLSFCAVVLSVIWIYQFAFSPSTVEAELVSAPGGGIMELGLSNGDSEWVFLSGPQACLVWSTNFDSASVSIETLVTGTTVVPTKLEDIDIAGLIGVTTDTGWQRFDAGVGYYRAVVSGGLGAEDINWHCRHIP